MRIYDLKVFVEIGENGRSWFLD